MKTAPAALVGTAWKSNRSGMIVEITGLWFGYKDGPRYEIFAPQIKDMIITERILTLGDLETKFTRIWNTR